MSFEKIAFNPKIWIFSYPWQPLQTNERKIAREKENLDSSRMLPSLGLASKNPKNLLLNLVLSLG